MVIQYKAMASAAALNGSDLSQGTGLRRSRDCLLLFFVCARLTCVGGCLCSVKQNAEKGGNRGTVAAAA